MTSSNTSRAPWSEQRVRSASRNPASGGTTPMFAATGSTITAAISPPRAPNASRTASTSLNGAESVSRAAPSVTPGEPGMPKVATPEPAPFASRRVRVAVVAALELQDEVAAGESAGEPDRAHRRLGPARDEPDHLHRRHGRDDALGELDLRSPSARRTWSRLGCRSCRFHDLGPRVAEQQRAPRLHEVDVAAAVRIDDVRALAPDREPRDAADRPERAHRRVHPSRDHAASALE